MLDASQVYSMKFLNGIWCDMIWVDFNGIYNKPIPIKNMDSDIIEWVAEIYLLAWILLYCTIDGM